MTVDAARLAVVEPFEAVVTLEAIILSCSGIEGGRKKHEQCHNDGEHNI
jgi:hypothetical protein